jgi:hypothetical protein
LRTSPIRFTRGPLGLVRADAPYHFVEETVGPGDTGDLIVEGDLPFTVPEGYVLVRVGDLYAPVDPGMIEPVLCLWAGTWRERDCAAPECPVHGS